MIAAARAVPSPTSQPPDGLRLAAALLSSHVDRLLRRFREEQPISPVEIYDLKDANELQKRYLREDDSPPLFERCPMEGCTEAAVTAISNHRRLCQAHADALQRLLGSKT